MSECPIWNTPAEYLISEPEGMKLTSPRAGGDYRIDRSAIREVELCSDAVKARLTTWLVDQRRQGENAPLVTSEEVKAARTSRPLRASDRKRRFFLYGISRDLQFCDRLKWKGTDNDELRGDLGGISAWTECRSDDDTVALLELLQEEGLIALAGGQIVLTSKGIDRMESLESGAQPSKQAFVAMWFDRSLSAAYDDGFEPAIVGAGFQPLRIDRKEHSNKIDDEIVAEIRRSRFVVADFTCELIPNDPKPISIARGGVYYEAGFAQGLGIPVIWCCRKDCFEHVHFDTRQFNHIVWENPEELRTRLTHRIGAIIT